MAKGDPVFVTGGTGFLGRHLVTRLLQEGYRLHLLVRPTSDVSWLKDHLLPGPPEKIELVQGDVTDAQAVQRGLAGCRFAVHAAGLFRLWGPAQAFQQVNAVGTQVVAEAAAREGIQRLVYISTVAVVGVPPPGEVIDEEIPCHPADPYQLSKYNAEQVLHCLANETGLSVVILRPGAFYGPGGRYGFNRLFIEDPLRWLRIQVDGGVHLIFPVFVKDVAGSVILALELSRSGEIYNICDEPVSHAQVDRVVSGLLGIRSWRLSVPQWLMLFVAHVMEWRARQNGQEPFYPLNLRHYVFRDWLVSSEKARTELGFVPTPLEEGLRQTVEWYRKLRIAPLDKSRK